mgnify:CR=1 FL=1
MPNGYSYKVFKSQESYSNAQEANKAKDIAFVEVKPHEGKIKQNNASSQVYTFPNISTEDLDKNKSGIFKLEVYDQNGKKLYYVKEVMKYKRMLSYTGPEH